jgi:hypothetical protein
MKSGTREVMKAEPFSFGELGSLGRANGMLIRQYQFPLQYESLDVLTSADHDRCRHWDHRHTERCFKEHTGTGDMGLAGWAGRAEPSKILAFVKDILKADPKTVWTGFRILGTINRSNGYPVWTLQLFAKHPHSITKVFSNSDAPNVLPGRRAV